MGCTVCLPAVLWLAVSVCLIVSGSSVPVCAICIYAASFNTMLNLTVNKINADRLTQKNK